LFEENMRTRRLALALAIAGGAAPAGAQWLNYPTPGTPLKKDGKVDLTAKAPRAFNRKPDLSGVWRIEPPKPGEIERLYHPSEVNAVAGDDWRDFDRPKNGLAMKIEQRDGFFVALIAGPDVVPPSE
jgi:hypothetical protein